jgi:hypothetical protein
MFVTQMQYVLLVVIIAFVLPRNVYSLAGRCYLCSHETLSECLGSRQANSSIYTNVLQYYTEPCNGQCVLFRNEKNFVERGCSWTYGHMRPKSIGWHDISPGIAAYFCDSYLCNNRTYEEQSMSNMNMTNPSTSFIIPDVQLFSNESEMVPSMMCM